MIAPRNRELEVEEAYEDAAFQEEEYRRRIVDDDRFWEPSAEETALEIQWDAARLDVIDAAQTLTVGKLVCAYELAQAHTQPLSDQYGPFIFVTDTYINPGAIFTDLYLETYKIIHGGGA